MVTILDADNRRLFTAEPDFFKLRLIEIADLHAVQVEVNGKAQFGVIFRTQKEAAVELLRCREWLDGAIKEPPAFGDEFFHFDDVPDCEVLPVSALEAFAAIEAIHEQSGGD